jgi:hypothetical protein
LNSVELREGFVWEMRNIIGFALFLFEEFAFAFVIFASSAGLGLLGELAFALGFGRGFPGGFVAGGFFLGGLSAGALEILIRTRREDRGRGLPRRSGRRRTGSFAGHFSQFGAAALREFLKAAPGFVVRRWRRGRGLRLNQSGRIVFFGFDAAGAEESFALALAGEFGFADGALLVEFSDQSADGGGADEKQDDCDFEKRGPVGVGPVAGLGEEGGHGVRVFKVRSSKFEWGGEVVRGNGRPGWGVLGAL